MASYVVSSASLARLHPGHSPRPNNQFTVSIDAKGHGVTTGISAYDRVQTMRGAIDASSYPEDFARPGHVFPLRSRAGGVLERRGQTEAAVNTSARAVSWIQHISLCSPRWLDRPSLA
jgi:3,4-dihydroxy-2-butanone 4-phosphate synthase